MFSQWSLSDSKSPQVSRTLLSILADLNNVVVWMVFTRPVISKSSNPCTNPLVTGPRAPITIGLTVTFMFHNFFNSWARSRYLFFFSFSFNFTLWSAVTAKSTIQHVLGFFLFLFLFFRGFLLLLQGLIVWPRLWDPFVFQSPIGVCVCHSPGPILGCANTICSYGQTLISCTISSGSPGPPSRV